MLLSELLPEILNTGIKEDRMSVVNLILSTLKTRVSFLLFTPHLEQIYEFDTYMCFCVFLLQVVLNKAISKTQKVSFFTPAVLANMASLYKWNGLVDVSTDDNVSTSFFSSSSSCWIETKIYTNVIITNGSKPLCL